MTKEAQAAGELQPMAAENKDENDNHFENMVHSFAEETSLPGVPRVILAKSKLSRYFWIIICLTCAISFTVGIVQLLQRYFSYDKKVTVEMVSEPVPFPHVTLCNMRSIDFEVLNKINDLFLEDQTVMKFVGKPTGYPFIDYYVKFIAKLSHMWYSEETVDRPEISTALNEAISRISLNNEIPDVIISEAGIQLDQYVARCSMGGVPCNLARDFKQFFNQYYFNCYTYNPAASATNANVSDDQLPWLSPGLDSGLSIVALTGSGMLKPNERAAVIPGLYDMGSATAGADGVRVIIHAPDVVPFPLSEGFDVPPGFSVSFGVRPRRNIRIGQPHGDCVSKSPFENEDPAEKQVGLSSKYQYRQIVCQRQCIQRFVESTCKCYDEHLLNPSNGKVGAKQERRDIPSCHATNHFPEVCVQAARPECFEALLIQHNRVRCAKTTRDRVRSSREMMTKCGCRAACNELLYDVSYSVSMWPASGYEGDAVYNELFASPDGPLFKSRFENSSLSKKTMVDTHFNESSKSRTEALRDFARINVYVADPEVVVTTESEDYDIAQLVSDIGGQLGVWIGLSVITAAEVIEFVLQIVGYCTHKKRKGGRDESAKKTSAVC